MDIACGRILEDVLEKIHVRRAEELFFGSALPSQPSRETIHATILASVELTHDCPLDLVIENIVAKVNLSCICFCVTQNLICSNSSNIIYNT